MNDTPKIRTTEERQAAVIHLMIPREEIRDVMEPAIREVIDAETAQGLAPAGPVFSHHLRMEPGIFDFEGVGAMRRGTNRGKR